MSQRIEDLERKPQTSQEAKRGDLEILCLKTGETVSIDCGNITPSAILDCPQCESTLVSFSKIPGERFTYVSQAPDHPILSGVFRDED